MGFAELLAEFSGGHELREACVEAVEMRVEGPRGWCRRVELQRRAMGVCCGGGRFCFIRIWLFDRSYVRR